MPDPWTGEPSAGESNPFTASRVRPGALPYLFPSGQSAADLVDRLRQANWRGQIIGPHGSGKSALILALAPQLELSGRHVRRHTLSQGQRRLSRPAWSSEEWTLEDLFIIDGFEQLSWFERWRVRWKCRRTGCGLLVTAHQDMGLPTLCQMQSSPELARRLAAELTAGRKALIADDEIDRAYHAAGGNLRETLFTLYDLWESRSAS